MWNNWKDYCEIRNESGFDPLLAQRYVGLNDKNSRDIYEGDILRWYHDSVSYTIVKVEYVCDQDHNGFYVVTGSYMRELTGNIASRTEVIGNIFQNPDLIKS
jgi:uncharacterized phage protein (TIGR01671 family)